MARRASLLCLGGWGLAHVAPMLLVFAALSGACHRSRFPARGDAASVVVVAPRTDAAAAPTLAEQEPNDKAEQAQLLALNPDWPVLSVDGALVASPPEAGKDVDVFKLVVPGRKDLRPQVIDSASIEDARSNARCLSLEASASGGALVLQLLDDTEKALESVVVEPSDKAGMPNMAVAPGRTYFVRIKSAAKAPSKPNEPAASHYRLSVQLSDFDLAEEREPDDSLATAMPMTGSADFSGFIGWPHDQDYYRLASPDVPSALDLEIEAVEGVALGVQVLDGGGTRIAAGRGRKGERLALRNVTIPAALGDASPASNFFHVLVRGESGHHRTQRYVVHLSMGSARQDSEIEPNDTAAGATVVHDGVFTGFLPIGDVDYFRYAEAGARDLTVEATCPARVRCTLEVVRAKDGHPLATADAKKAKQTISVTNVPTQGEPVLFRLGQGKGDGNANESYALRIASVPSAMPPSGTQNSPSP